MARPPGMLISLPPGTSLNPESPNVARIYDALSWKREIAKLEPGRLLSG